MTGKPETIRVGNWRKSRYVYSSVPARDGNCLAIKISGKAGKI